MAIVPDHTALGVRRLTRAEYGNTVADLLGVQAAEAGLPAEVRIATFSNNVHGLQVSQLAAQALTQAAEQISTQALPKLALPTGCKLATLTDSCVHTFLTSWLKRALRRAPSAAELSRYEALYQALKATAPSDEALRGVIESVLDSPSFLYRFEVGDAAGQLSGYEIANRLSYLTWASMPDDALLAAAERGDLSTASGRTAQLERLWADPKASRALRAFGREWLGVSSAAVSRKDASVLAGTGDWLQPDLETEFNLLFDNQLFARTGSLPAFLAGQTTYVTPALARLYGLPAPSSGTTAQAVSLKGTARRGVLTSGLMFVGHAKESGNSVPQLGRFVRQDVLCQLIPSPPPDVVLTPPKPSPDRTYRQQFEALTGANPSCQGCHRFINPPGFAFLPFDPIGRHADVDTEGKPFDTASDFPSLDGVTVRVTDAADMAEKVAGSERARACFSRRLVEYTMGRTLAEADLPLQQALTTVLKADSSLHAAVTAIVQSATFTQRGPIQ